MAGAVCALVATVATPAGGTPSQAPQADFAIQPSGPDGPGGRDYFVYTLKPGEVFGDTVGLSNFSDKPQKFFIYATDAFNTEGEAAFALLKEQDKPVDVGTWIELGAKQYTVAPGKRVDIPFSVTVPADAQPGDHAGAIVAQPAIATSDPTDDEFSFDFRLRIGARVYVRVDGAMEPSLGITKLEFDHEGSLNPLTAGDATIRYTVTNTGNLRLAPVATVRIKGPFGITLKELEPRQLPELLPGGKLEIADTATNLPQVGRLTAEVVVSAEGAETKGTESEWAVPWLLVAIVIALGGWYAVRRRRRRRLATPDLPPSRERERVPA